uniref:Uncharacterized protein n=1 Tax=Tetraselmis sp. GSL018 TaxID=582737 RepID=A0A061R2G7_9CHLO
MKPTKGTMKKIKGGEDANRAHGAVGGRLAQRQRFDGARSSERWSTSTRSLPGHQGSRLYGSRRAYGSRWAQRV